MKRPAPFNPADVAVNTTGSATGGERSFSRADQVRTHTVTLIHRPTGLQVSASHGPDRLSKTAWWTKKQEMESGLMVELARLVGSRKAPPRP